MNCITCFLGAGHGLAPGGMLGGDAVRCRAPLIESRNGLLTAEPHAHQAQGRLENRAPISTVFRVDWHGMPRLESIGLCSEIRPMICCTVPSSRVDGSSRFWLTGFGWERVRFMLHEAVVCIDLGDGVTFGENDVAVVVWATGLRNGRRKPTLTLRLLSVRRQLPQVVTTRCLERLFIVP